MRLIKMADHVAFTPNPKRPFERPYLQKAAIWNCKLDPTSTIDSQDPSEVFDFDTYIRSSLLLGRLMRRFKLQTIKTAR